MSFLLHISISQITVTIGANHLSTKCVSKTEISNICVKADTFLKSIKMSKSPEETIEFIALKKRKEKKKGKTPK